MPEFKHPVTHENGGHCFFSGPIYGSETAAKNTYLDSALKNARS